MLKPRFRGEVLPAPELALNPVRASELVHALQNEFDSAAWRRAIEVERARFLARGGRIERLPLGTVRVRSRGHYID